MGVGAYPHYTEHSAKAPFEADMTEMKKLADRLAKINAKRLVDGPVGRFSGRKAGRNIFHEVGRTIARHAARNAKAFGFRRLSRIGAYKVKVTVSKSRPYIYMKVRAGGFKKSMQQGLESEDRRSRSKSGLEASVAQWGFYPHFGVGTNRGYGIRPYLYRASDTVVGQINRQFGDEWSENIESLMVGKRARHLRYSTYTG